MGKGLQEAFYFVEVIGGGFWLVFAEPVFKGSELGLGVAIVFIGESALEVGFNVY